MRFTMALVLVPALLCAQVYLEAFGQTLPFKLAAGSHSGWDEAAAVEQVNILPGSGPVMSLYPNPARNQLVVTVKGKGRVDIFTVTGKKVHSLEFTDNKTSISADNLANGVYFARLYAKDRTVSTARFLVVR